MLVRTLALLLVVGLAGCDATDSDGRQAEAQSGEVALALGATASLDGLPLTFSSIVDDSRCPQDAVCVWEGMAQVSLDAGGQTVTLTVGDPEKQPEAGVRVGGKVLYATRLTPEPRTTPSSDTPVVTVVSFDR